MSAAATSASFTPAAPHSFEDLGISPALVTDLLVRRAYLEGVSTVFGLCESLKLPHRVVEQVFRSLRQQQLIEVKGIEGEDYAFSLTNAGNRLARNRRKISQYAGPAPVSIGDYDLAVRSQAARVKINRATLARVFSDIVVTDSMLDQLGPALVSQKSLFLYGPTGNGKTSFAERLARIYEDDIWLPYAVEVDSQVIVVYDPVIHERTDGTGPDFDPRWVRIRRPFLAVGGELTPSMLELRLDEGTQVYAAPLQMKANNGILVIDDFGRQVMSPRKLLNRWILPLDRRIDYLSLRYGVKFAVPFELMVVFATNLEPTDLADEAFLRRIHNKVYVDAVSPEVFDEIFERIVRDRRIPASPGAAAYLRRLCAEAGCATLKACYPADICTIVQWLEEYEARTPEVTADTLDRAVALYFTHASGRSGPISRD